MAQHDYNIANQSGAAFRADLNNALSAIVTDNSGASAPSPTFAYMVWADTSTNTLKRRNAANSAWQIIGDLAGNVLVLDSNKNVGIGTATPSSYNASYDNLVVAQGSGDGGITIVTGTSSKGGIAFADGTSGSDAFRGYMFYDHAFDRMQIGAQGELRVQFGSQGASFINANSGITISARSTDAAGTSVTLMEAVNSSNADLTGGAQCFRIFTNGNVQNTNNSYGAISDIKLKENIADASSQWDDIKAIRIRKYNLKQGQTHRQIGVIAQEIEQVSPGLVYESPDRDENGLELDTVTKSVNYSVLYMKAVKALQEAMERIETLEAKVAALEAAPTVEDETPAT